MSDAHIAFRGVYKLFGTQRAVDRLDFDYLRAQIGQGPGRAWPGPSLGQIENPRAFEVE